MRRADEDRERAEGVANQLAAALDEDYTKSIVPMSKRKSNITIAILWATLQAALIVMVIGFLARSQGLTLGQLMLAALVAVAIIMLYGFGAANLGAYTGQTHTLLTRTIFGRVGSGIVSVLLVLVGLGWYSFQAFFFATVLQAFFPLHNLSLWAAAFAIVMITNNLLGFTGISGYAVYVCTPLLIGWGLWTLIKGFVTVPASTLLSAPPGAPTTTVLAMSLLIIGGLAWGNEPDFFRYSNPRRWYNVPTLLFGYCFGAVIFTAAGYLMAELSNATEFGPIMQYFVQFSLFGLTALGIIIFAVNVVASNDGNLYEAINAAQNIFRWRRVISVVLLGGIAALVASQMGSLQDVLFIVAGISGIFVPCATTIMVMDVFVVPRLFNLHRPVDRVTPWSTTALANWIAVAALLCALALGALTGGLIPGLPGFGKTTIGYPPLQAWALSGALYLLGVLLVRKSGRRYELLGYPTDYQPTGGITAQSVTERAVVKQG